MNRALYQTGGRASSGRIVRSPAALAKVALEVAAQSPTNVWLLRGPLGSGKTTFVRGLLRGFGFRGIVSSPTFTLVRHYRIARGPWRRVVHVDAYRLRDRAEEVALDLETAMHDPLCLLCIEWPEKLQRKYRWTATTFTFQHMQRGRRVHWTRGGRA